MDDIKMSGFSWQEDKDFRKKENRDILSMQNRMMPEDLLSELKI
jgi:hypothetical protein